MNEYEPLREPRQRGPDVLQWEYMTWGVIRPHSDKAQIRFIDGRPPLNPPSLFDELERAGEAGWELVSVVLEGWRPLGFLGGAQQPSYRAIFKAPA